MKALAQGEMSESFALGQLALVLALCECRVLQERMRKPEGRGLLLSSEFLPVMKCSVDHILDRWLCGERHLGLTWLYPGLIHLTNHKLIRSQLSNYFWSNYFRSHKFGGLDETDQPLWMIMASD